MRGTQSGRASLAGAPERPACPAPAGPRELQLGGGRARARPRGGARGELRAELIGARSIDTDEVFGFYSEFHRH